MRFGVVVPHFNDSRFLRESLLAYLADTPAPDSVVVVDDGSSQPERESASRIVGSLQSTRTTRLKFHASEENLGPIAAQNIGLALTDCDFVQFRAADDRSVPGYLRRVSPVCGQHPNAGLAVGDIVYRTESGGDGVLESLRFGQEGYIGPDALAELLNAGRILHSAAVWYNAPLFRRSGGFLAETDLYHDWWACHQLAFRHGIIYTPHPAAYFTLRSDSQSSTHFQDTARAKRSAEAIYRLLDREDREVQSRFFKSGILDFFASVRDQPADLCRVRTPGGIYEVLHSRLALLRSKILPHSAEVWVYGTGNHSQYLVTAWTDLGLPEIRGFVQSAPPTTDSFLGKPVVALDGLQARGTTLLVLSSKSFEEAMAVSCIQSMPTSKILSFWNRDLTTI